MFADTRNEPSIPTRDVMCSRHEVFSNHCDENYENTTQKSFGEISSLRGVQNIFKADNTFVRNLWLTFVISMTCVLLVASSHLMIEYLKYETLWNSGILRDQNSTFPSVTFCAHNPFSLAANQVWESGQVKSPSELNSRLLNLTIRMVRLGEYNSATNMAFWDSYEMYYTNLAPNDTVRVGHKFDMFTFCMIFQETEVIVAEKCEIQAQPPMQSRSFSHPKYFNCWTIEEKPRNKKGMTDVRRLLLLVRLVPSSQIMEARNSFISDVFTRGEGIKLVVHEPNTYPDIEEQSLEVQPNLMNEIIYHPKMWNRKPTPANPCREDPGLILDLGINYTYTHKKCLELAVQHAIMSECGCMQAELPRPIKQISDLRHYPYCITLSEDQNETYVVGNLTQRLQCVASVVSRMKQIKEEASSSGICLPRCKYHTYDTRMSVTKWDPSPTKLSIYADKYRLIDNLHQIPKDKLEVERWIDAYNKSIHGLSQQERVSSFSGLNFSAHGQFRDSQFTYISIIRQSSDLKTETEHLVFDEAILLSRIGGLCSLCIGLTMAFFVEIIEYIYRLCYKKHETTKQRGQSRRRSKKIEIIS